MSDIVKALERTGTTKAAIPVSISYRIIELFSAGLYSSPNKAVEELVANSYDAGARTVSVVVPEDMSAPEAVIWVADDGASMDEGGLFELWQIAASRKRDPGRESASRPPIGRFGIGKLASYVLANQLTHITKVGGVYRAVTMDFHQVDRDKSADSRIELPIRELTEAQAAALLAPLSRSMGDSSSRFKLFGEEASPTWTVAAVSDFKPLAFGLKVGRLKWVLSTALPMSPQFTLFVNGNVLESSKQKTEPLNTWFIGVDDAVAADQRLDVLKDPSGVRIPGVGPVYGSSEIYADPLTSGKASQWGRSHGIFVTVRKRLINIDDALFGLPALSHGPFARFRMEIEADGLDDALRATREAVLQTPGVDALRAYIQGKFNEARVYYAETLREVEQKQLIATRIGTAPQSLARRPLVNAIRLVLEGKLPALALTEVPRFAKPEDRREFLAKLEAEVDAPHGVIREVKLATIGVEQGIAVFHPASGILYVNALHPFYANYADHFTSVEPFELLAVAEVLTEGYLVEEGLASETVNRILHRRDRFLRELVYSQRLAPPLVAELLRDSVSNEVQLESAVARALATLGFDVSPIGGSGKPDGIAHAVVGVRNPGVGRSDYSICYEAKSSGKPRVKSKDLNLATMARHRTQFGADFSLLVAPGFEGEEDPKGAVNQDARVHGVTLITARDLVNLILVASTHRLAFLQLRELFATCRTPEECRRWIEIQRSQAPSEWPVPEILDAIWELQQDEQLRDPVQFAAVRMVTPSMRRFTAPELADWMASVKRFAPQYITLDGDVVYLEVPPERIIREVRLHVQKLPIQYRPDALTRGLADN
jgi:hypothetical protein